MSIFAAGELSDAERIINVLIEMAAEPGQDAKHRAISKARKDLLIPVYRAIQNLDRDELFAVSKVLVEALAILICTINPGEEFIELNLKELRRKIDEGVRVRAEAMMKAGVKNVRTH